MVMVAPPYHAAATVARCPLVRDPASIRLGIAGRVAEDDHPYSWSAILNGYDAPVMARHADPAIATYLGQRSADEFGIAGVRVTHVWADAPDDARKIADASRIPHVVDRVEAMIGHVDAVLIPTDIGSEHVRRARPFVEAGVPVFIDKPLVDNADDLATFERWVAAGRAIASSSGFRYAPAFVQLKHELASIGEVRLITITVAKSWARYGIHALEAIYPLLPSGGWLDAVNVGDGATDIVQYRHANGARAIVAVIDDLYGAFGVLNVYGTTGHRVARYGDSFTAFKTQLAGFVSYLQTGVPAVPFEQTVELMRMLIAGRVSAERGGERIRLNCQTANPRPQHERRSCPA